jgi:putative ABC transport system substrate-binding protein
MSTVRLVRIGLAVILALGILSAPRGANAQPPAKVPRVGVILQGGEYYVMVEGLRAGLRELRLEEGKHFALEIRDLKGDLKAAAQAARNLERDKVNLIYTTATSITLPVKQATTDVPIVFVIGSDPVSVGLVESFAKPGGRLTGLHFLTRELTAKRLEVLKEMLPTLRRIVTFYDANSPTRREGAKIAREAARKLGIEMVERQVGSVKELQESLKALRAGEADAYFYMPDAMVASQAQLIIDTARAKRLPTMFQDTALVAKGALVSYGVSFHEAGRLSAKHVQRVLAGTSPKDLPVESVDRLELVLNLRTARELGLTIPREIRLRADKVIE